MNCKYNIKKSKVYIFFHFFYNIFKQIAKYINYILIINYLTKVKIFCFAIVKHSDYSVSVLKYGSQTFGLVYFRVEIW